MKLRQCALIVCALALAAQAPAGARTLAAEQIDKTFELSPGASVEVSSISGSVVVEVGDFRVAEVHVERTGRTDCAPMIVEGSASRLVVRVQQEHGSRCRHEENVRLRLPASVNFSASSISGDVTVGTLEGEVRMSSISGSVRIGGASGRLDLSSISGDVDVDRATGTAKISSISGTVRLTIAELAEGGITANSISGNVELGIVGSVGADVTVDSISGSVGGQLDDLRVTKLSDSSFRGTIGAGGPRIAISSISGDVKFSRR